MSLKGILIGRLYCTVTVYSIGTSSSVSASLTLAVISLMGSLPFSLIIYLHPPYAIETTTINNLSSICYLLHNH